MYLALAWHRLRATRGGSQSGHPGCLVANFLPGKIACNDQDVIGSRFEPDRSLEVLRFLGKPNEFTVTIHGERRDASGATGYTSDK